MAKYLDALAQARWMTKCMFGVTGGALLIAAYAIAGLKSVPEDLTLHIPPSLTMGAQLKAGQHEVPDPNVYIFGYYIWQQLNRWSENGKVDYGNQIFKLQAFFTPACREQLVNDLKARDGNGELDQRTRSISEIPGLGFSEERVKKMADGSWTVIMDAQVEETSRGVPVKDIYIRYPLHIVRFDIDRERNPWQLGVDCYVPGATPERLDPKAVELAISKSGGLVQNSQAYSDKSIGGGVDNSAQPKAAGASPAAAVGPDIRRDPVAPGVSPATLPAARDQ